MLEKNKNTQLPDIEKGYSLLIHFKKAWKRERSLSYLTFSFFRKESKTALFKSK